MKLTVNGHETFCYTGGKPFDAAKPTVVFIHGVLNDHSVWILQSRWFANHGWNVLAVDLPGHCKSGGPPPASVEEAAQFVIALLDAAGVQKAALVGHSFGSLIALEAASRALMRRVLASNRDANVFHIGFKACNDYANGEKAIEAVQCPVLFLLGDADQMTPPRATKALAGKAKQAKVVTVHAGHSLMNEAPDEVLFALRDFVGTPA